ncbi:MAG: histone deacetylase family protein [Dongiaceae bacterium]
MRLKISFDRNAVMNDRVRNDPFTSPRVKLLAHEVCRQFLPDEAFYAPCPATMEDLFLAHPPAYVKAVMNAIPGYGSIDLGYELALQALGDPLAAKNRAREFGEEVWLDHRSGDHLMSAAGSGLDALRRLQADEADVIVCLDNSNHHAERLRPMGFCTFGNVGLTALAAAQQGVRVLSFDCDVHEGNGTADIVKDNKNILHVSLHLRVSEAAKKRGDPVCQNEYPYRPIGWQEITASNILNIGLPEGTDGRLYRDVMTHQVLPRIREFKPTLAIITFGCDAIAGDAIGGFNLTPQDLVKACLRILPLAESKAIIRAAGCYTMTNAVQGFAHLIGSLTRQSPESIQEIIKNLSEKAKRSDQLLYRRRQLAGQQLAH